MGLHPLEAIEVPVAANHRPGKSPVLMWLPISKLRIDRSYQRDITPKGRSNIAHIVSEFSWARFSPILVTEAGGGLFCIIDGQHRATAALCRGYESVPCAIVEAKQSEQAQIFTAVNSNVTKVTIFELFKAGRAAGLEWAKAIDRVCQSAGLVPLVYPKPQSVIKPFETMALGTLRREIIRFGEADCIAALKQHARLLGAKEPGFWNSVAISSAISTYRENRGLKRVTGATDTISVAQRIRDLKAKGHTRFAIQAALKVSLSDIEAALAGADQ